MRRPEASATLASVLDRMTDKDLRRRYPDAATLIADLEEALAIEAARSGRSTGEATAVLRTLPPETRRRLPFRLRHPLPVLGVIAVLAAAAVIVTLLALEAEDRAQRGTGPGKIEAPAGESVVSVARTSAEDYDPQGDQAEHSDEAPLVVDREPGTTWSTETYSDGIEGAGKEGVGIYVDAKPGVEAVRMEIQTTEPGWTAEIYGANGDAVPPDIDTGWTRIGDVNMRRDRQRFRINEQGESFRYYLVWITSLPESQRAEISEIALFRRSS
jgi:eukaryotic-like serine/threonine-protein kinase